MPYASADDLYVRYGRDAARRLTDNADLPTGEPIAAKVSEALDAASREIDSYLAARYSLPFADDNTPAVLRDKCLDLAWSFLHRDYPTDASTILSQDVRRWLRDVAAGKVTLGRDGDGDVVPSNEDGAATVSMVGGTFSDRATAGFTPQ